MVGTLSLVVGEYVLIQAVDYHYYYYHYYYYYYYGTLIQ